MLRCTRRVTPARFAAKNGMRECSTAFAELAGPWSKRTQKVL